MKNTVNYLLILLLILTSGSAALFAFQLGFLLPLIALLFWGIRRMKLSLYEMVFLAATAILIFAQNIFHTGSLMLNSGVFQMLTITTILLISKLTFKDFAIRFRRIMVFLSATSLFFWAAMLIEPGIRSVLFDFAGRFPQLYAEQLMDVKEPISRQHFFLFNVFEQHIIRNPGMFYEPGRFAIFIVLAFLFKTISGKSGSFNREDLLYIITSISTFSTAGYVALFLVLWLKISQTKTHFAFRLFLIVAFAVASYFVFGLDFMGDKILFDFRNPEEYSRFFALVYHFELISQSPLIGWGTHYEYLELSPNGLTMLVLRWGALFGLVYYFLLYKGIHKLTGAGSNGFLVSVVSFLVVIAVAFSQTVTTDPLYFAFIFYGLARKPKTEINYESSNSRAMQLSIPGRVGSY